MSTGKVDRKAAAVAARKAKEKHEQKSGKTHRTLNLTDRGYLALQKHLAGTKLTVSEVVDDLIEAYLAEI